MTVGYRKYFTHSFFKHLLSIFYIPHSELDTEDAEIIKPWYLLRLRLSQAAPYHLLVTKRCMAPLPMLCLHLAPCQGNAVHPTQMCAQRSPPGLSTDQAFCLFPHQGKMQLPVLDYWPPWLTNNNKKNNNKKCISQSPSMIGRNI